MNHGRLIYKQSMDGFWVPVVNSKPLYSLTNTQKSCDDFCNRYLGPASRSKHILFVGLGLNHHIDQLLLKSNQSQFAKRHSIFEINSKLVHDLPKMHSNPTSSFVFNFKLPYEVFENEDFINFMLLKPCFAIHQESVSIGRRFYTELSQYPLTKTLNTIFRPFQESIAAELGINKSTQEIQPKQHGLIAR